MRTAALALLAALLSPARPLAAQELRARPAIAWPGRLQGDSLRPRAPALLRRPWVKPVSSLLVPGTGQLEAGQSRGLVYLGAELWIVSRVLASGNRGREAAGQFRTLMYDVARRQFNPTPTAGPWEYYEAAEKFVESGVYNSTPNGSAFTPEGDTTTFNGALWLLARRTFFVNPDSAPAATSAPYQAAIHFYILHAVTDDLRYSWRGARLEQDVYRGEITASDNAFRARTNYLGVLVINHLVSAIDALISLRLGRHPAAVPAVNLDPASGALLLSWTGKF